MISLVLSIPMFTVGGRVKCPLIRLNRLLRFRCNLRVKGVRKWLLDALLYLMMPFCSMKVEAFKFLVNIFQQLLIASSKKTNWIIWERLSRRSGLLHL